MSVIQPYQFLKFTHSIDDQLRYQEGSGYDLCNIPVIPQGEFVPFGIVSNSNQIGLKTLYCHTNEEYSYPLMTLNATLLPDGDYFNFYNGDDISLDCGIYYLAIQIGTEIWYSDLFQIKDISNQSIIPEIKYKSSHLALPIYDSIYKQNRWLNGDNCSGIIVPVDQLIPFFTDDVTFIINEEVIVYLVDLNTGVETEITAELSMDYGQQQYLYSSGGYFQDYLACGVYYLHFHTNSGDWYSETFIVKDITNLIVPETDCYLVDEGGNFILTESGEKIIVPCQEIFFNEYKFQVFTKNDCAPGFTGSNETYSVPAKTYNSLISQADADQQALDDIAANGQDYANTYGTCTPIPLPVIFNDEFNNPAELANYAAIWPTNSMSISSGELHLTQAGTTDASFKRTFDNSGIIIGHNYKLSFTVTSNNMVHLGSIRIFNVSHNTNFPLGLNELTVTCLNNSFNYIQFNNNSAEIWPVGAIFAFGDLKLEEV